MGATKIQANTSNKNTVSETPAGIATMRVEILGYWGVLLNQPLIIAYLMATGVGEMV